MRETGPSPRDARASSMRDAHGQILGREGGALFVHLHRETGLAHRHYVLRGWQVRALQVLSSRPMRLVYVALLASWGWMASQATRVPILRHQVVELERDRVRLDSLSATLTSLQARYDQVQNMLSAASAAQAQTPQASQDTVDRTTR